MRSLRLALLPLVVLLIAPTTSSAQKLKTSETLTTTPSTTTSKQLVVATARADTATDTLLIQGANFGDAVNALLRDAPT